MPKVSSEHRDKSNRDQFLEDWRIFQVQVKAHGLGSASGHLGVLVKQENARLAGQEAPNTVSVTVLRRQLSGYAKRRLEILQILEKSQADKRVQRLATAYGINADCSNADVVIRKLVLDHNVEQSPVQRFLDAGGTEAEIQFIIEAIQTKREMSKITRQLLETQKKLYTTTDESSFGEVSDEKAD